MGRWRGEIEKGEHDNNKQIKIPTIDSTHTSTHTLQELKLRVDYRVEYNIVENTKTEMK